MSTRTSFHTRPALSTQTLTLLVTALVAILLVVGVVWVIASSPVLWTAAAMVFAVFLVPLGLPALVIWTVSGEF